MFLVSNYQPIKTKLKSFPEVFNTLLNQSKSLEIVTGYVSEKSIKYLAEHILKNGGPTLNLTVGMHYFDKFTYSQYTAALELESFLEKYSLGAVNLITSFPFHGKIYSFGGGDAPKCIMGSSNLDNIVFKNPRVQYETDILVKNEEDVNNINAFILDLKENSSSRLSNIEINEFRKTNNLLEGLSAVDKLEPH